MESNEETKVVVNGQEMTVEEFQKLKETLDKNTILVENSSNNYSTRMYD